MKVYTCGLDQMIVSELKKHEYIAIMQMSLPDPADVENQVLFVTSEVVPFESLAEFRQKYSTCTLVYHYMVSGLRGYMHVHALCESLKIYFLSPRASFSTILDVLKVIFDRNTEVKGNIVGVFSSGMGIGATRIARTMAKRIAAKGFKVMVLGLDLYDPGWNGKAPFSLDQLRPRLTGKIIESRDFEQFISKEGFSYLPGNCDMLSTLDYQEDELEYLLQVAGEAKKFAEVVIADFGSVPESAAWYVGLQKSNIRYYVSHPIHEPKVKQHIEIFEHLQLKPSDFLLIANHSDMDGDLAVKSFASETGMHLSLELPHYANAFLDYTLPLGKREQQLLDDHVDSLLVSMGLKEESKKRGLF